MNLRKKTIVALDFSSSSDSLPCGITQNYHLQLRVSCPVQEHLAKMGEGDGAKFQPTYEVGAPEAGSKPKVHYGIMGAFEISIDAEGEARQ